MDCNCPKATALETIGTQDCPVNLNQIQRLAFQRGGTIFDSANGTPTDIKLKANWDALIGADDATKIVVTPTIGGDPTIDPGDAITEGGGDNSTLNGVEENTGTNPSVFSAVFKSLKPSIEKSLKKLMCENSLTVFLFLQGGKIGAVEITADEKHKGFDIQSLFVSDRSNQGFGTKDINNISFQLPAGWSEDLVIITPTDFNPLTDL